MRSPPRILIADDQPENIEILQRRLSGQDYEIVTAGDGEQALAAATEMHPDLILLDVMMPKMDGIEVCRRVKSHASLPFIPIIMITARADNSDLVAGLNAGADEYLTKPVDPVALVARIKSILRIKALHDTVQEQAAQLSRQATELAAWNRTLEQRVAAQLEEIERMSRLKRFLSPQVADLVVASGDESLLESHRREVTVVFCDLRGFTPFAETAEPEEVMGVLREYHDSMGQLVFRYEGTLERFAGDGFMVIFNDPVVVADPAVRAVRMAVDMRTEAARLSQQWRIRGHDLEFGAGIAQGYATLGKIGFEGRYDYAAIGSVTNLASRLCDRAEGGQILVTQRVQAAASDIGRIDNLGDHPLPGFHRSVVVYNVVGLNDG